MVEKLTKPLGNGNGPTLITVSFYTLVAALVGVFLFINQTQMNSIDTKLDSIKKMLTLKVEHVSERVCRVERRVERIEDDFYRKVQP